MGAEHHPVAPASLYVQDRTLAALHTIVGMILFGMVGGAAWLLNFAIALLSAATVSRYIIDVVQGLEFFLFAADIICLVAFVIKETWIFSREIIR
jgi:hypothetical protein